MSKKAPAPPPPNDPQILKFVQEKVVKHTVQEGGPDHPLFGNGVSAARRRIPPAADRRPAWLRISETVADRGGQEPRARRAEDREGPRRGSPADRARAALTACG